MVMTYFEGVELIYFLTYYRVIQVKVDETKQLFQIENMDRFLFKWYSNYCKGGEFCMAPKKISSGKENSNYKMGNLALTEILSVW